MATAVNAARAGPVALPKDALLPRDTRCALPIALLRAREAVMVRFRPIFLARRMTEQQWRIIRVLADECPLDATEVVERTCVLAPSLTRIIKVLEERKLITREHDATDGRRISLALAPAGMDMIREVTPEISATYAELEAHYGHQRVNLLLDMLDDLAELKN